MEKLIVVVSCYKNDFFLTRTCVASVKYFHPEAEVYLLKDYLAGSFDSSELEQAFQVKVIDLGKKEYGWGAAKVHFVLSEIFRNERVFIIDSDTVFVGRFLRKLYDKTKGIDFVVDPEFYTSPYDGNVPLHYYKFDELKKFDPDFVFPGFVFNTGHLIVTPGKVTPRDAYDLFDINTFPYYKRLDILYMPDQSLFNYLFIKMRDAGQLTLTPVPLMAWSEGSQAKAVELEEVKKGDKYDFLIHWAGARRISYLNVMTRSDILLFFEDYYYTKVPFGAIKKQARRTIAVSDYYLRKIYRKTLKPLIKREPN
ncbi:MAG TPA: hypothetical protein VFO93_00690 [Hymenobacter sp.]|uniref:hypothetical protein n=1 Tax=Hymenobacter sp. TaxID=1898978 RepID=UPI002D7F859A|nr:hypothetical protein [Hymenobacter sp.]HET9502025.1 hypothetical protein [Hymenobacter sp.]